MRYQTEFSNYTAVYLDNPRHLFNVFEIGITGT